MNILHVDLDFGTGGAEKFIVHLSNEQAKQHDVTILSLWKVDPEKDIFVNQIDSKVKFITFNKKKGIDIRVVIKLISLFKKKKFDVVHTHRSSVNYVLLTKVLFFKNLNVVHTIHNDAYKETPNKILRFIKSFLAKRNYFKPVTISEESNRSFVKAYGINAPLVYNGTPKLCKTKDFLSIKKQMQIIKGGGDLILSVGRISKQKNYQCLIDVVQELISEGFDISLVIIGRIDLKLNISNKEKIHLIGIKNNPFDYMNCSDFFCLSSLYEGLPITLIESIQSEAVNIITPVGGMKDIIQDSISGFVSSDVSKKEIKITIKRALMTNQTDREKISLEAKKKFNKKFNIENVSKNYKKVYDS